MILLALLLVFGLAPHLPAQRGGLQLKLAGPIIWVKMDTANSWVVVPGTPMEVFGKAQQVYKDLKIKTNMVDSSAGMMGNSGFVHTGSFAGRRMSAWIRCGEGITGPHADNWRVSLAVLSAVEPVTKDSTKIRTLVVASARNMAEGSSTTMMCTTSGQLEEAINLKVRTLAGVPANGS